MTKEELPDVQQTEPKIKIPIHQVGVDNIEVPFLLESRFGGFHSMIAKVSIRTDLNENTKGISMSRLLLTLKPYLDVPLKRVLIKEILEKIRVNLECTNAHMKFEFKLPIKKKSLISDNEFPLYYCCKFEGQLQQNYLFQNNLKVDCFDSFIFYQGVSVQYSSYCPCSSELCNDLKSKGKIGFPHAQRSFASVLIESGDPVIWLEELISLIENSIKTLPYPIIKRVDEQEIARIAGENPIFVEDAIRQISTALNSDSRIKDWIVKCVHEESIHTSNAIAINWKGIEDGFNGTHFL